MNVRTERTLQIPCTVEIEHTPESLHAHVDLGDFEVGPGDRVLVQGTPTIVPFGETMTFDCYATVVRAGPLRKLRARIEGYLELTELYEVGFSDGRA
jgi:hypothetical protein